MREWRFIEDEEFDREFADVCERVFGPDFWNGFWDDEWDDAKDSIFADGAWRVTLLPQTPFYWYCPEHWISERGEIRRPEIYKRGARGEGYPPIKPYFASYFEPFCLTLAELGVDEVVVTTRWDVGVKGADGRYHRYSADEFTEDGYRLYKPIHGVLRPTLEIFLDTELDRDVDLWGGGIFSRDGNWGMLCDDFGKGFSVLGGTPEFMDTYDRVIGGVRNARAFLSHFLLMGGGSLANGGDEYDKRFLEKLYRMVGWPFPNRWYVEHDEEIDWSWMMDDEGFPEK